MRTLRTRLTAWYIVIITASLTLFAGLLYVWLARTLYAHHDQELLDDAARLAHSLGGTPNLLAVLRSLDTAQPGEPLLIVRDASGTTVFRSAALASENAEMGQHAALRSAAVHGQASPRFFTVRLEHGAQARFVCVPLLRPGGLSLELGRRLGDVDRLLSVVLLASISLIPVVAVLTSYGGFFVARRALEPIARIAQTLESIQATDLSKRVSDQGTDEELGRLAASVNVLLDRVERAFASLREFASDVSHQLQTPLTIIRSGVDVALSADRSAREYERTLREVQDDVDALAETVQDIRDFSLAEADSTGSNRTRVDLRGVFTEAAELISVLAEDRGIRCDVVARDRLDVWGNRIQLRQLVLNLGENAVKFTEPQGRIELTLEAHGRRAVFRVTDTGHGIPAEALPHVYERRFRADRADPGRGGSGLGLALAKRIVDAHGGTIAIGQPAAGGTMVTVELPTAESA